MWSDRLAASSRQAFVEGLRHVLAAPRPDRPSYAAGLSWDGEAIDGAAALWAQRHFLWLDQPPAARLAVDPVARLTVTDGMAIIQGPNRKVSIWWKRLSRRGAGLRKLWWPATWVTSWVAR